MAQQGTRLTRNGKATPQNRRQAERHDVSKEVAFVVDSDRSRISHSAFAVDLSTLGARIRTTLKLEPGQQITVIPKEGSAQAVPSRVIWVAEQGRWGHGEAGVAFLQPTTLEV